MILRVCGERCLLQVYHRLRNGLLSANRLLIHHWSVGKCHAQQAQPHRHSARLLLPGLRQDKALCTGLPSKRVVVVNVLHRVKVRVRDQDLVVGALLHRLVVVLTHVRTKSSRLINSRQ